jgi:metallo-beta-lactamase class B
MRAFFACLFALACLGPAVTQASVPASWTEPVAPFRIADDLYYVGSQDLASYLVVTPAGNVLINANLPESPAQIRKSVESLGLHWEDTRILLDSQAHYDHMGGAQAIVRETQAKNMVMEGDVDVAETGGKADFLTPSPNLSLYAPVHVDRVLHDRDTVSLGGVTLTAHRTAGHTRGCTTWTMCAHLPGEPAGRLRDIVIVGGTAFWSEFHFVDTPEHAASYPGIAEDFARTFATLRALPCDVFLGAHGGYFDLASKLPRYAKRGPRAFLDAKGYRRYIASAEKGFTEALQEQTKAATAPRSR